MEDTEYTTGKVDAALVGALADAFVGAGSAQGVYDMLKSVGGPLWGAHGYPTTLIAGSAQPIDIVILNFDRNSKPFGMVGYFWGLHNLLCSVEPTSNEAVSLYLDAETLYLGGASGMQAMKMVIAHEGMHMQNFYRRSVLIGPSYSFDDWLEEMTAMMMEDFASHTIDASFNNIRDVRMPDYVRTNSSNCNLFFFTGFGAFCESYSVSGTFGGFLNRQLGLSFFKDLLARGTNTNSKTVLEQSIANAQPGMTLAEQMRRWAVSTNTLMPNTGRPATAIRRAPTAASRCRRSTCRTMRRSRRRRRCCPTCLPTAATWCVPARSWAPTATPCACRPAPRCRWWRTDEREWGDAASGDLNKSHKAARPARPGGALRSCSPYRRTAPTP